MSVSGVEERGGRTGLTKRPMLLFGVAAVGVALLLWGGFEKDDADETPRSEAYAQVREYEDVLEERIRRVVVSMEGIDSAAVLVTVDGGSRYELAYMGEAYPHDYLVIDGDAGEEAVVLKEIYPEILGVGVVCTDGERSEVRARVVSLLSTALGIPAGRIQVTGM